MRRLFLLDGNGALDLIVARTAKRGWNLEGCCPGNPGTGVTATFGIGHGRFGATIDLPAAHVTDVIAADLDGDGRTDLAIAGRNAIHVYQRRP